MQVGYLSLNLVINRFSDTLESLIVDGEIQIENQVSRLGNELADRFIWNGLVKEVQE